MNFTKYPQTKKEKTKSHSQYNSILSEPTFFTAPEIDKDITEANS